MSNPLIYLLLGLLVAWVGSYFYSFQHNRRKLRWLADWLREALAILGSGTRSRWQGADRLDVFVDQGRRPVREAALVIGLQSRQFFRLLVSLVRRGRDSLTALVSLQETPAPGREFEIFETAGPLPKVVTTAAETGASNWTITDFNPRYKIASTTPEGYESARRALTLLLDDGFQLRRLSVRANAPHIMLVLNVGRLPQTEARSLLQLLRNLAEEVTLSVAKSSTRPPKNAPTTRSAKKKAGLDPITRLPRDGSPPAPGLDPGLSLPRSTNGHKATENEHPPFN